MSFAQLGSITDLTLDHKGHGVLVGSHGGLAVGQYAIHMGVSALICHDAGVGRREAGVASLTLLDRYAVPAVAVSHKTARIGDAADMMARGTISHLNETARKLGLGPHIACSEACELMSKAIAVTANNCGATVLLDTPVFGRYDIEPNYGWSSSGRTIVALDSASSISVEDAQSIVITGSHGGLPGNSSNRAIKYKPSLVFFNDAGIGIDDAGISRLPALDDLKVAAACVDCWSACIGDGRSTCKYGVISVVNEKAKSLSILPGMSVRNAVKTFIDKTKLKFFA